jgi:hypothetical protein
MGMWSHRAAAEPKTTPPAPSSRWLTAAAVAYLAARGIAAGEDLGLSRRPTDTSGLLIDLFGIGVGVSALAAWALSRAPRPAGVGVVASLAALAVAVFAAAATAAADRPAAMLAAWHFAAAPVVFLAPWLLASRPGPFRSANADRWLAVLLAGAAAAAVAAIVPPALERLGRLPAVPPDPLALGAADDLAPRVMPDGPPARIAFERPDTAAAVLLGALPAAAAAATLGPRPLTARLVLALLAAGLGATGQGAAALALVLAGAVALTVGWRTPLARWPGRLATVASLAGGFAAGAALRDPATFLPSPRAAWAAAVAVLRGHPVLGVGPGQSDHPLRQYLAADAPAAADAGSAPLELALAGGALAVVVALAGLLFLVRALRTAPPDAADVASHAEEPLPWEFHVGGGVGLLIGFVLRMADRAGLDDPHGVLTAGALMAGRSAAWFAAFAVFETVRWADSGRRRVLTAGLGAVLLFGLVSSAPLLPAAAVPALAAAALALASRPSVAAGPVTPWLRGLAVLPAVAVFVSFGLLAVVPAESASWSLRKLMQLGRAAEELRATAARATPQEKARLARGLRAMVTRAVPGAYQRSAADRPAAAVLVATAHALMLERELSGSTADRQTLARQAVETAKLAAAADPLGTAGMRTHLFVHLSLVVAAPDRRATHWKEAGVLVQSIISRDPAAEARLRCAWAKAAKAAKDDATARDQATRALRSDEEAAGPRGRLTDTQREQLRAIVGR